MIWERTQNPYWVMYNPHPKGEGDRDCVKRALCAVTGIDYMKVQRDLNRFKRDLIRNKEIDEKSTFRSMQVGLRLCQLNGWQRIGNDDDYEDYSQMTGKQFCQEHPHGKYILQMPKHWTACVDGQLWDKWDSTSEGVAWAFVVESGENYD